MAAGSMGWWGAGGGKRVGLPIWAFIVWSLAGRGEQGQGGRKWIGSLSEEGSSGSSGHWLSTSTAMEGIRNEVLTFTLSGDPAVNAFYLWSEWHGIKVYSVDSESEQDARETDWCETLQSRFFTASRLIPCRSPLALHSC